MKRAFATIILLDVVLLLAPTRWMGSHLEVWLAAGLAAAAAVLWLWLQVARQE